MLLSKKSVHMRILHFYKTFHPDTVGGIEQTIHQLASGLVQHGAVVDVLSLTPEVNAAAKNVNGYTSHRARLDLEIASTGLSRSVFGKFEELARKADIIHFHFPWPLMDLVHFRTRARKPTVVTYHSDIVRQKALLFLYRPMMYAFLSSVDHIVATSPNYLKTSSVLSRLKDKVSIIPIGLNESSYPNPSADRIAHWRCAIGDRFFLFIGAFRYYKGLHILLDAASKNGLPVVIVGTGPTERELKAQAVRLGLRNVHFLGHVEEQDKVALLELCCGVVFPSHLRSEAFGVTLLEGALFSRPLISSEIGTGTSYVNIDGETGLVVAPADASELSSAMLALWSNPAKAETLGKNAYARFRGLFTSDQMVKAHLDLYGSLLSRRPQR